MGRIKADGSQPLKHRKAHWRGPQAKPRTRVQLEQRSCLVILADEVLCHVPSHQKHRATGDRCDLMLQFYLFGRL
jgi:hypothetical protein